MRVCIRENQGPRFEINYVIARKQKRDEYVASFQSLPKIRHACSSQDSFAYNASATSRDSYPQFPRSPLVTLGTMIPLMARTQSKKEEGNACIFRVSLLK